MKGFKWLDFENIKCSSKYKIQGKCNYNGECRHWILVYKATCKIYNMYYIGNTQQKLKLRMGQ